ncbi:MAG: UDP-N-acetylglucosamine--N-acetylmuramyl-(pentapeptide) pyrophosphoryl-undecaprenol N-acetylglucosamine transferase [bacterium]|nr:UDP-N-acetylglucosamine--N-acetylmuramyl-(pentapeptide) pyrophosphoryl-undecaprenol N-acetylglucosamine transferase [bacterium]
MKILTTGGHLTPALAFIDYVVCHSDLSVEFVFLGRTFSQLENKQRSHERRAIEKRNIRFIPFQSGKLSYHSPLQLITQSWQVCVGLVQAMNILKTKKPDVVVLFGGYLAVPVAIASWIKRIPVITHEQTAVASLSNQIISLFSKKIAVSYRSSLSQFPQSKTVFTGNLLRQKLEDKSPKMPNWYAATDNYPLLYITGGNQGSQVINATIAQILPQLTKDWTIIHQCGAPTKKTNYRQQLEDEIARHSKPSQQRYFVKEWITEDELSWIYKNAAIVISRAGANTVFELQHFGIPSILIPLPFSHKQEQLRNAEQAVQSGGSILLTQNHLNPESLLAAIKQLASNRAARRKKMQLEDKDVNGTKKFWDLVSSCFVT